MAISGGDGSIILTTSVDTSGISRGSNSIKTMLQGVGNTAKATGAKIQSAFASFKGQRETFKALTQAIKDQQYVINSLNKEYAKLVAKGKQNSTEAKKLKGNINELEAEMRELRYSAKAVGTTSGTALGKLGAGLKKIATYLLGIHLIFRFIDFSREAGELATQQEASVQRLIDIYGKASIAVGDFIDANSRGLGLSKAIATSTVATYGNLLSVWADQKTNAELSTSLLNQTAVVASKTGRTVEDVAERIRSGLLGNTEAIEDLGINVNIKTIEITDAFKRIADGRSWQQLNAYEQAQVRTLAILEQSTKKYGTSVANTTAFTRQQYNAAFQDFQATWGQVVNLVLIPILRLATRVLNALTAGLRAIAGLSGKTIDNNKQLEAQKNAIGGAVDNQEALTDEVKETVKAQQKLLAGFDEIEMLSSQTVNISPTENDTQIETLGNVDSGTAKIDEGKYTEALARIGGVVGVALIGLGIIMMFSGHPIIGIAMVAMGFGIIKESVEGGAELGEEEKIKLARIGAVVGVALIGLGVLLLFTPLHWAYGLAMIALGAMGVYFAYSLGEFSQDVKTLVSKILLISGIVAFILGVILLFTPLHWKYGLGLMLLGVAEIVGASKLGGEELKKELETFVLGYWKEIYAIAILMVIVGMALLFTPGTWAYGLGLVALGIVGIVGASKLGGEELKKELETFVLKYWQDIYTIGFLMILIGITLLFTPALGVGIALLVAGASLITEATILGGEELKTQLTEFSDKYWKEIYAMGILMVIVGIALLFTPAFGFGIALIISGIGSVVAVENLDTVTFTEKITGMTEKIQEWIGNYSILLSILGIILLFVPGMAPFGIGLLAKTGSDLFETFTKEEEFSAEGLKDKLVSELKGVYDAISGIVDKITSKLDEIYNRKVGDTGFSLSDYNATSDESYEADFSSVGFRVPALARGAVLPANKPFLAMVGDQKQGTNVEAPLSVIEQAVSNVLNQQGNNMSGNSTVVMQIDGREFGRAVVQYGNTENRRVGTRLVSI